MATLTVYTDFVCPFCFIAEKSTIPKLVSEFELELEWHGFELHPRTPKGGMPLTDLFPGADLTALHERTQRFAAGFGVTDFQPPSWLSNTRASLAIAEFSREEGKLAAFRQAAFSANFERNLNLEDETVLGGLATEAGLDPQRAVAAAKDEGYLARVDERQRQARRAGVSGIPTLVLGDSRIVGCQPYEELVEFVRRELGS